MTMVERRNIGGTQAFCRCHDDSVGASQRQIRILRDEFGRSGEVVSGGSHNSSVRAKREVGEELSLDGGSAGLAD